MEIDEKLNKKRSMTLVWICFFVYLFAQITKSALSANINSIMEHYQVLESDTGIATSAFQFCYGIGQIINAFFCIKYNKKNVISASLFLSFASTVLFCFDIPFGLIKFLSAINGLAHSTLWLLLLLKINQTIDRKYLAKAAIIMSFASTFGAFLSYGVCSIFSALNYYIGSFIAASGLIFISLILWITYSVKEPVIIKSEPNEERTENNEKKKNKFSIDLIVIIVLFSLLSATAFGVNSSLKTWAPAILKKTYGIEDWLSILLTLTLPLINIFNSLFADFFYKKLKDFAIVCLVFFFVTILLVILLNIFIQKSLVIGLSLFILVCLSTGIIYNSLTVQAPLLLGNSKMNSGMLAGLYNGFGYVGSFAITLCLGFIAENKGWNAIFPFVTIIAICSFIICLIYLILKLYRNNKKQENPAEIQ